jgi:hypothetical protein
MYGDVVECIVNVDSTTTSVRDLVSNKTDLVIFPNPCSESLNFVVPYQSFQIARVLNLSGQTVMQQPINTLQNLIDTRLLNSGMYLLLVKGEEKTMTQKFIKN